MKNAANLWADRRQFGRRESNIDGYVAVAGQMPVACRIVNISDGGALLEIDGSVRLPAAFRLVVEDTRFNLMCELRHKSGTRVGVRFAHLAEGIALNRHFQRTPCEPDKGEIKLQPICPPRARSPASIRDLRRTVLGVEPAFTPVTVDAVAADVEPLDTGDVNAATLAALAALAAVRSRTAFALS